VRLHTGKTAMGREGIVIGLTMVLLLAGHTAGSDEVILKSRRFVPPTGLDDSLRSQARTTADLRAQTTSDRLHVIVQLENVPTVERRIELAAAGVQLLSYIPNHAWLAAVKTDQLARVAALPGVRAVARIPAAIPWRCRGAAPIKALLLGDINVPVPNPITPSENTIERTDECTVAGECETVADERPQHGHKKGCGQTLRHGGEDVLLAHHAGIEQGEARDGHHQHQAGGADDPCGIGRIYLGALRQGRRRDDHCSCDESEAQRRPCHVIPPISYAC